MKFDEAINELKKNYESNMFLRSGYGLDKKSIDSCVGEFRTLSSREVCRAENFKRFMRLFHEQMPDNFSIDDFKLNCWKGMMWWGDDRKYEFNFRTTLQISLWIISMYGK